MLLAIIIFILLIIVYQKLTIASCGSTKRLDGKTVVVTGGTAGMGLETAKDLAKRGARVIVACPFKDEGIAAEKYLKETTKNKDIEFRLLDLGSLKSTREFAEDILKTETRLDVLINNAGIGGPNVKTEDGLNLIMQVNYYGAYLLTLLLLPLMRKTGTAEEPSRIVNVTSALHFLGRVNFENDVEKNLFNYSNSKYDLVLFAREMSTRLAGTNVVINSVDPGLVGTNIYKTWNWFLGHIIVALLLVIFKNPEQGAQTTIFAAVDDEGKQSGKYFKNCGVSFLKRSLSDGVANKVFRETASIVGLSESEVNKCFD